MNNGLIMGWRFASRFIIVQALLFAVIFSFSVTGNPLKLNNTVINATTLKDDPVFQKLVIWANEKTKNNSLNNRNALPTFSQKKLNEQESMLKENINITMMKSGPVENFATCLACTTGVEVIFKIIRAGEGENEIIKSLATLICTFLKIQSQEVCDGAVEVFAPGVVQALKNLTGPVSARDICSFLAQDLCEDEYSKNHNWLITFPIVPKPKPSAVVLKAFPKQIRSNKLKVLQLSDTHFDPYYEEGSNANCGLPLCCRISSGPVKNDSDRAGMWGDYRNCDTPKRTIENMFQHISSTHPDIDYIIWTGDLPAHDVWNSTREENLNILKQTVEQMSTAFPKTPIYPSVGNHESVPINSFVPPSMEDDKLSMDWLYSELDNNWKRWLPENSTSETIRKGAFYSVLVQPGFRIISLNMNYCYNLNWWLMINSTDPADELQWFINELQSAETKGEKVHVIGHIPPGNTDCVTIWSKNYYSIVSRYESTIAAQFFGHTHFDEFEVFYDPNSDWTRPVGISYICPSVTPYNNLNPGYRIYYVDDLTRAVLDHETWVMNLDEVNLNGNPVWYKLYSAQEDYQMPNLTPAEWHNLVNKLNTNDQLFEKYHKYYWKNSAVKPSCDKECKKNLICDLRSGRSHSGKLLC